MKDKLKINYFMTKISKKNCKFIQIHKIIDGLNF